MEIFKDIPTGEKQFEILRAAERRFAKHGVKRTTLAEIARDLRVSKSSLYHYFTSKQELYIETLRNQAEEFLKKIQSIFNDEAQPVRERIGAYLMLKADLRTQHALLYELIISDLAAEHGSPEAELLIALSNEEGKIIKFVFSALSKEPDVSGSEKGLLFALHTYSLPLLQSLFLEKLSTQHPLLREQLISMYIDYFGIEGE